MNAKQYLKQAYRLNDLINSDLAELDQLRALSVRVSAQGMTGMPSGGSHKQEAPFVNAVMKIIELEKTIDAEVKRLVALKKEIRDVINRLEDNDQKLCLKLRYIQYLKWAAVADEMCLSEKQVYRIHEEALENIEVPTWIDNVCVK